MIQGMIKVRSDKLCYDNNLGMAEGVECLHY